MTFIVWEDEKGSPAYELEALSFSDCDNGFDNAPVKAGEFAIIQDRTTSDRWFGQIIEPQRNFGKNALARNSGSTVGAYERIWDGRIESSVFTQQYHYYRIALLGEIQADNRLHAVVRRPVAGSLGKRATEEEVLKYLHMPQAVSGQTNNNILGYISDMSIPIPIDEKLIFKHFLVAGATGSGKSNTLANMIKVAQQYGMCVIVFDHKPDYQNLDIANTETELFTEHLPFPIKTVDYYSLYRKETDDHARPDEQKIAVKASEFDPQMLAATIFYRPSEDLAVEVFGRLMVAFSEELKEKNISDWTLAGFKKWFDEKHKEKRISDFFGGTTPSKSTLDTAYKISSRTPDWVDALEHMKNEPPEGAYGIISRARHISEDEDQPNLERYFDPKGCLEKGKVVVIRINAEGREYGLFLSFILRRIFEMRRNGEIKFPVVCLIDEAQDIFEGSTLLRETAVYAINEYVRKGRSKKMGFIFAVQSASQIPDKILQNLNSRVIHRQNTKEELKIVIPSASPELLHTALTFGPGEALVSLADSRAVLHGKMLPSPFELTKTD